MQKCKQLFVSHQSCRSVRSTIDSYNSSIRGLRINRLPHIPSSISITLPCSDRTAVIIYSQVTTTQSINSQYTRSSRKSAERLFLPRTWSHRSFKLHCFVWVTGHMNVLDRCIAQTLQRVDVIIFFHSTSARVRMITQGRCTDV